MIDISVSNLVKEFEVGNRILDGLSFQVDSGERVGLLGKNGAGKTTLFRILTGELDCDEGEAPCAGETGGADLPDSRLPGGLYGGGRPEYRLRPNSRHGAGAE